MQVSTDAALDAYRKAYSEAADKAILLTAYAADLERQLAEARQQLNAQQPAPPEPVQDAPAGVSEPGTPWGGGYAAQ